MLLFKFCKHEDAFFLKMGIHISCICTNAIVIIVIYVIFFNMAKHTENVQLLRSYTGVNLFILHLTVLK